MDAQNPLEKQGSLLTNSLVTPKAKQIIGLESSS